MAPCSAWSASGSSPGILYPHRGATDAGQGGRQASAPRVLTQRTFWTNGQKPAPLPCTHRAGCVHSPEDRGAGQGTREPPVSARLPPRKAAARPRQGQRAVRGLSALGVGSQCPSQDSIPAHGSQRPQPRRSSPSHPGSRPVSANPPGSPRAQPGPPLPLRCQAPAEEVWATHTPANQLTVLEPSPGPGPHLLQGRGTRTFSRAVRTPASSLLF